MINPKLIEHIFKAANISRWNDYPKMIELSELDKQAHKFIIAYFIAKLENDVDMRYIIEGGVFEFLSRVVVTDIRPDVFHHIQKTKASEINNWVLTNLEPLIEDIEDGKFLDRFKSYLEDKGHKKERLILKAASYLATKWEFSIVYQTSKFLNDIDELKQKVDEELEDYYELIGVRKIAMNQKLARIVDLGHMLVVAIFGYFYSIKVGANSKRLENNFYCALFHDLPESLTRDIISPVKYGIDGLNEIISDYEMRLIEDKILPYIPQSFRDEFSYILGVRSDDGVFKKDEFENRICRTTPQPYHGSMSNVNDDEYNSIDGKALKYCDRLAAFVEAGLSISYGVKSKDLVKGFQNIRAKFKKSPKIEGVDFDKICRDFMKDLDIENLSPDDCGTHL